MNLFHTRFTVLLAYRYLRSPYTRKTMGYITIATLTLCSAALSLIVALMNGFQQATTKQLQATHAPIILHSSGSHFNLDAVSQRFATQFPEIERFSPVDMRQVLVQGSNNSALLVMLHGIVPMEESHIVNLISYIIEPATGPVNIEEIITGNQLLIGSQLAQQLRLQAGDHLSIVWSSDLQTKGNKLLLETTDATVGGILHTGIDEIDQYVIYSTLEYLQELFCDAGPAYLHIKPHQDVAIEPLIDKLNKLDGISAQSWQELYASIMAALKLEKYAMFLILMIICLLATSNIIALTTINLLQKKVDVAILQTMGMRAAQISSVFLLMITILSISATVLGLLISWIVGSLLRYVPLPDAYYIEYIPVIFEWHTFIILFFFIPTLSALITLWTLHTHRQQTITNILRFQ